MLQPSGKEFVYYRSEERQQKQKELTRDALSKLLLALGREAIKEKMPNLQELERLLQKMLAKEGVSVEDLSEETEPGREEGIEGEGTAVVKYLMQKGYLKEGEKWLSKYGFINIGARILNDVMKALKSGDLGMHETVKLGSGTTVLDTSKKYEAGDDIRLLNVPKSLLNTVQRIVKRSGEVEFPLDIEIDDFEEYETMQEVRVAIAYCIDLSSTMRYSSMFGEMSRIEAAKRALWSLYVLNRRFFPTDMIYVIGFGALASKVLPPDIPYLKTFEPGHDFLHYTNYQAAFRLASKILQKDGALNKRIVLITDGHPSACFVDNDSEKDKILSARPYSHFYKPDRDTLDIVKEKQDMSLDITSGELVYLCYRYRQVDPYIAVKTVAEAKKCMGAGMDIDSLMVSEEDALLSFVNDMEKHVKGRSYYINPSNLDRLLITDYLLNKKKTINMHSF
ncbi:MAG: VWA domain-containing protein [Nitrososphaerales archaeon]